MSAPRRVQRKRERGWRMPSGARYVGRPTRWGNPFRIYHGHTSIGPAWSLARETWHHIPATECVNAYVTSSTPMGPEAAVELYRDLLHVRARDEGDRLREWLAPLAGLDLACWCPLPAEGQPDWCHAAVLLRVANPELAEATR